MALWIFWLAYALASDHLGRQYVLGRDDLRGIPLQMKFYLFEIFKGEDNPFKASPGAKFNPLQKLAYGSVMCFFAPVMILTGLLFLNAFFVRDSLLASDAYIAIDAVHTAGFYFFAVFLVIHIYMATLGPTIFSHIKTMIVAMRKSRPGALKRWAVKPANSPKKGNFDHGRLWRVVRKGSPCRFVDGTHVDRGHHRKI